MGDRAFTKKTRCDILYRQTDYKSQNTKAVHLAYLQNTYGGIERADSIWKRAVYDKAIKSQFKLEDEGDQLIHLKLQIGLSNLLVLEIFQHIAQHVVSASTDAD